MEKIFTQSLYEFDLAKGEKIIGVDEAGRGPLAGPVVAAATLLKKIRCFVGRDSRFQEVDGEKKRSLVFYDSELFLCGNWEGKCGGD